MTIHFDAHTEHVSPPVPASAPVRVRKVGGRLGDKDAVRAAIRAAQFSSVRGPFEFGANHYPVQDFWLCQVAKRADGKFQTETVRKVLSHDTDPYAAECRMR